MSLEQINGGDVRVYRWDPEDGTEPTDLLSVTSIRSLCGEPSNLVSWKLANLADAALGTMQRTKIGPRGGVQETRQVFEYPCEFATMYDASGGDQGKIDDLRRWLREQGDAPRNIAAARGSIVHRAIENNVAWDRIERPYVESAFADLSQRDRKRVKREINDEDVAFVRNAMRQYWSMRAEVPMVILAREVRVVNLTAGYAGTFDVLVWLLGAFAPDGTFTPMVVNGRLPSGANVTVQDVADTGGTIALLDWKTAKDLHTDNVVQAHAYLAAEKAIVDGHVDERVTGLLTAADYGGLAHIRPNKWGLSLFPFESEAVRAFLGSVAFARFLARHPRPDDIFTTSLTGTSTETDDE